MLTLFTNKKEITTPAKLLMVIIILFSTTYFLVGVKTFLSSHNLFLFFVIWMANGGASSTYRFSALSLANWNIDYNIKDLDFLYR